MWMQAFTMDEVRDRGEPITGVPNDRVFLAEEGEAMSMNLGVIGSHNLRTSPPTLPPSRSRP
jgi:hypothetical protein